MLLLIQPTPQNVSPCLTSILEKYAWESSSPLVRESDSLRSDRGSPNPTPGGIVGNQYLSDEVFLLLQSIVMAVQVKNERKNGGNFLAIGTIFYSFDR